jgi:hypothetical protein
MVASVTVEWRIGPPYGWGTNRNVAGTPVAGKKPWGYVPAIRPPPGIRVGKPATRGFGMGWRFT